MVLLPATKFSPSVGQDTQQGDIMFFKERDHAVVQKISSYQSVLAVVELGEGDLRIGVNKRLLIDSAHTFKCAHIERILGTRIAWMSGLGITIGLFLLLGFLQSSRLPFGKNDTSLGGFGLQGFQSQPEDM